MNFYIGQALSFIALIVSIIGTQSKSVKRVLVTQIISNLTVALSFLFLGGISGAWVCLVAMVQTIVMYILNNRQISEKLHKCLMILFILIYVAGTALVYQGWTDIVSCACAILYVLAIMQKDTAKYRKIIFFNSLLWLIYDVSTLAYVNIVLHGMLLVSLISAMIRLDRKKPLDEETKESE